LSRIHKQKLYQGCPVSENSPVMCFRSGRLSEHGFFKPLIDKANQINHDALISGANWLEQLNSALLDDESQGISGGVLLSLLTKTATSDLDVCVHFVSSNDGKGKVVEKGDTSCDKNKNNVEESKAPPRISVNLLKDFEDPFQLKVKRSKKCETGIGDNDRPTKEQEYNNTTDTDEEHEALLEIINSAGPCGIAEKAFVHPVPTALLKSGKVVRVPCSDHYRYVTEKHSEIWTVKRVAGDEMIRVVSRRWISLDGTVNENVFKLCLQALAVTILQNPGISFKTLVKEFHPYLSAIDVEYLINNELIMRLQLIIPRDDNLKVRSGSLFDIDESENVNYVPNLQTLPNGWCELIASQ